MSTGDLPKFAAKGERQKLDRDWIKLLHQEGLPTFLPRAERSIEAVYREITYRWTRQADAIKTWPGTVRRPS